MEKRLQLLLDAHRYELVEREARSSGRSVAAVIRESIDRRFDDASAGRAEAVRRLLRRTETPEDGPPIDWAQEKRRMADEVEAALGADS